MYRAEIMSDIGLRRFRHLPLQKCHRVLHF